MLTHLNIEAHVFVSLVMSSVQFGDELAALHTRVLSQSTWQRLKGFSKLLNGVLLQTRAGLHRERETVILAFCNLSVGAVTNKQKKNRWKH